MVITCSNINKSFGTDNILKDVSFHINEYERVGIVGINGSGKSTLFKIIVGDLNADSGEVFFAKGKTLGYLSQDQGLTSTNTIYDELLSVKQDIIDLNNKIRDLEQTIAQAQGEKLETLLKQYSNLTHEFEINNGYAYKSEVTGILKGLGFYVEDFDKKIDTLSGGQVTRVALGKLLLSKPDIILLDEPTNNLDLISILWLETFLLNYKGTVVVISHDRYFIDKLATKIIDIENTKALSYTGNYSDFIDKKDLYQLSTIKQYENQQREIKHQEEVIAKLRSFNREKSIKRAESREKLLDKITVLDKPITHQAKMKFDLAPRITSGNDVLTINDLSKSFADNLLFDDLDFNIKRGEKVALIGYNGTGKSTILKIITDNIKADFGEVKLGTNVHIGYYDQKHEVLDQNKTLFDELQDTYPNLDNTSIRNVLAAFLFTEDDVFKLIRELSGGERGRVSLAKLMLSESNFLILDEPTNHLDINSKEILENAINNYTGTVLYVSHDRYFINKTATRILDLTQRKLINYIGNYDYYLEKKEELEAVYLDSNKALDVSSKDNSISEAKLNWQEQKKEQARIRKRQNDLKRLEEEIHILETKLSKIDEELSREEIFTNPEELVKLNKVREDTEFWLEEAMNRWEELAE